VNKVIIWLALLAPGISFSQAIPAPTGVSATQVTPTSAKVCWTIPANAASLGGVNVFTATTDAALTAIDTANTNKAMIGGGTIGAVTLGCYTAVNLPTGLNVFDVNFWACTANPCPISPPSAHAAVTLSATPPVVSTPPCYPPNAYDFTVTLSPPSLFDWVASTGNPYFIVSWFCATATGYTGYGFYGYRSELPTNWYTTLQGYLTGGTAALNAAWTANVTTTDTALLPLLQAQMAASVPP
jgi:hypothetical protein